MNTRVAIHGAILLLSILSPFRAAWCGTDVVASKSQTIQPNGPRTGDDGAKYFNVEGKNNGKYASFGVLTFELPKDVDVNKVKSLTLTLVQTAPKFAKAGAIKVFLASNLDSKAELKFDAEAADGVGKQIEPLQELGSGDFKDPKPDHVQSLNLKWSDALKDRIAKGGRLYLVIVPEGPAVAATFRGVDEKAQDKSPKLTLE